MCASASTITDMMSELGRTVANGTISDTYTETVADTAQLPASARSRQNYRSVMQCPTQATDEMNLPTEKTDVHGPKAMHGACPLPTTCPAAIILLSCQAIILLSCHRLCA
jgi:hypothetical protein